jgi:hypothetical protein
MQVTPCHDTEKLHKQTSLSEDFAISETFALPSQALTLEGFKYRQTVRRQNFFLKNMFFYIPK